MVGLTKVVALETRGGRHHLQRDLPGLRAHAAGRGPDRRAGQGTRAAARAGDQGGDPGSQPSKRFVEVEDLAGLTLFLCSDAAARSPARRCRSTAAGPRDERGRRRRTDQARQSGAAGRRRARRLHLGRARPPARGRRHRDRGHLRHQRRRHERGGARPRHRAEAAARRRARRSTASGAASPSAARFSPIQRTPLDRLLGSWRLDFSPG